MKFANVLCLFEIFGMFTMYTHLRVATINRTPGKESRLYILYTFRITASNSNFVELYFCKYFFYFHFEIILKCNSECIVLELIVSKQPSEVYWILNTHIFHFFYCSMKTRTVTTLSSGFTSLEMMQKHSLFEYANETQLHQNWL